MGRLGLVDESHDGAVLESISTINRLPNLETEGVYTHFAASDEADKTSALEQLRQFKNILADINRRGISIPSSTQPTAPQLLISLIHTLTWSVPESCFTVFTRQTESISRMLT